MRRRKALALLTTLVCADQYTTTLAQPASGAVGKPAAGSDQSPKVSINSPLPRPLARFNAGTAGSVDIAGVVGHYRPGVTRLRLRANIVGSRGQPTPFVDVASQYPEYSLDGSTLRFDGSRRPATSVGASAIRLQIEVTDSSFDDVSAVLISDLATVQVDAPPARIRHGLDAWDSFDALSRTVQGEAPAGSPPTGRIDLIGQTFEITPGMLSEPEPTAGRDRPAPVAAVQFPCTITAQDPQRRPVLRSISGERDIIQIQATLLPPIDGEVVLRDLVVRDNRSWRDTGEAGVRIKDRFAGRSVRIERCDLIRCQNAVAGGGLGQTLRIIDCRIVDCGFGEQAHGLYVQPEWLEFFGNLVMQSPGNRLARAHLLKSRALNARILGNRFVMNDCPGSYLIDLSNGGQIELGGNLLEFGTASDNSGATLIAYAAEGARGDAGGRTPTFSAGRGFSLVARNNTLTSAFAGRTQFFVVNKHLGLRSEGGTVSSWPEPLVIADNRLQHRGQALLVLGRDRSAARPTDEDQSAQFPNNSWSHGRGAAGGVVAATADRNSVGPYAARRFTGSSAMGTGSEPYTFLSRGGD